MEAAGGSVNADHAHPAPSALNLLCPPLSKASAGGLVSFAFLKKNYFKPTETVLSVKKKKKLKQFQSVSGIRFINHTLFQTDEVIAHF